MVINLFNLMSISTGLDMYFTIVLELPVNHRNEEMGTYDRSVNGLGLERIDLNQDPFSNNKF